MTKTDNMTIHFACLEEKYEIGEHILLTAVSLGCELCGRTPAIVHICIILRQN